VLLLLLLLPNGLKRGLSASFFHVLVKQVTACGQKNQKQRTAEQ
jgi:hypothetical protein